MKLYPTPLLNEHGHRCYVDIDDIVEVAEHPSVTPKGHRIVSITWMRGQTAFTKNLQMREGHDLDTFCQALNEHHQKREASLAAALTKGTKQLDAMAQVILDTVVKKLTPQWQKQITAHQEKLPELVDELLPAAMQKVLAEQDATEAVAAGASAAGR